MEPTESVNKYNSLVVAWGVFNFQAPRALNIFATVLTRFFVYFLQITAMNLEIILFSHRFKEYITGYNTAANGQMLSLLYDLVNNVDVFLQSQSTLPDPHNINLDMNLIKCERVLVCLHCDVSLLSASVFVTNNYIPIMI